MSNILLISAPGAGKGVTSEYLKEKYHKPGNVKRKTC